MCFYTIPPDSLPDFCCGEGDNRVQVRQERGLKVKNMYSLFKYLEIVLFKGVIINSIFKRLNEFESSAVPDCSR